MTQLEKNNNNYQTIIYILACLTSLFGLLHLFGAVWFWTYVKKITIISYFLLVIVPLFYILAHKKIKMLAIFLVTFVIVLYDLTFDSSFVKIIQTVDLFSFAYIIALLLCLLFFILVIKDETIIIYKKFIK